MWICYQTYPFPSTITEFGTSKCLSLYVWKNMKCQLLYKLADIPNFKLTSHSWKWTLSLYKEAFSWCALLLLELPMCLLWMQDFLLTASSQVLLQWNTQNFIQYLHIRATYYNHAVSKVLNKYNHLYLLVAYSDEINVFFISLWYIRNTVYFWCVVDHAS